MQSTPPVRRRTQASRAAQMHTPAPEPPRRAELPPEPPQRKKKSRKGVIAALVAFVLLLTVIVVISPNEAITRARFTSSDASGSVASATGASDMYEGLVISEVMSSNGTSVPDDRGEYGDWLEIWNSSDRPISLKNVGLSDRSDSIRFLFPDITLEPDGRVIVYCTDTNAAEAGRAFHAKFKISSVGETLYLFEPSAYLIHSVTTPVLNSDESYALMADGSYAVTDRYSPGFPNGEEGYQAYLTSTMVATGDLIINEVMADPLSGLADGDGEFVDWIELHNTTDRTIDLSHYALSDKENKPLQWRFPEGATIAPGGYYIVFCSGKDRIDAGTNIPHANFSISAEHDSVVLSDGYGRLVDRVTIDNLPEDCSFGRDSNGEFIIFTLATPSLPNTQAGAGQMDYHMRQMNASGVIISEVMLSNDSVDAAVGGYYEDWIELYNTGSQTVDLSGYGLSDNIGRARKWQFPEGTVIGPGEYKIIYCDGQNGLGADGQIHTSFSLSWQVSETVCLSDPTGRVLDKLVLPEVPTNISYGRTLGRTGFFYYETPTPLRANNDDGFLGYAEEPTFTVAPGLHYQAVNVGINVPEGCTVYYTTDGSVPTQSSTPYNGQEIQFTFTTVLRARAFYTSEYKPSSVTTGTYLINVYHTLPVVALTVDPYDLWNDDTGLYAPGPNIDKSVFPFKNTTYRYVKEELGDKEAYVEYYGLDGTQILSQGAGVSLQGQFSLDMPQKTFKLRAKSLYGESTFAAPLFDDRPYTEYKGFVLRNSGNDNVWTRLLDGWQHELMQSYGSTVIHQSWNPVIVYLNGEYWGHYNMRERVDRFFVAQWEGLPLEEAGNMDILEASGAVKYGSNAEYRAMVKRIKKMNPNENPEDRQYIEDNIDIDNHIEYMAFMMFFGNSDPGNTRYYRLDEEGSKWRWIFYDSDYGMFRYGYNSPRSYLDPDGMGDQDIDNTIFLKILEVDEWRDKFLRKLGHIFQTFTTEYMLSVLEPMVDQIAPEMQLHWARWGELNEPNIIAEAPRTADGAYRYWVKRVDRLRNTIKIRPWQLYEFIQEEFNLTDAEMLEYFGERPELPPDALL